MAYVLHITKKRDWAEQEPQISREEWESLKANGILESTGDEKYPDGTYAKWEDIYFSFRSGDITCVGPDKRGIQKMKEIASLLGAHVQGDDGEFY